MYGDGLVVPDGALEGDFLGDGVGGHDGARCVVGRLGGWREGAYGLRNTGDVGLEGHLHADDAGGGHEHLLFRTAKCICHELGRGQGTPHARLAGGGVCIAGVEDDGAGATGCGTLARHLHGRGAELVLREGGCAGAGGVCRYEREVLAVGVGAKARVDASSADTLSCADAARAAVEAKGGGVGYGRRDTDGVMAWHDGLVSHGRESTMVQRCG